VDSGVVREALGGQGGLETHLIGGVAHGVGVDPRVERFDVKLGVLGHGHEEQVSVAGVGGLAVLGVYVEEHGHLVAAVLERLELHQHWGCHGDLTALHVVAADVSEEFHEESVLVYSHEPPDPAPASLLDHLGAHPLGLPCVLPHSEATLHLLSKLRTVDVVTLGQSLTHHTQEEAHRK